MIGVIQLSSHLADAPKAIDHFPMGFHAPDVRSQRTYVNGENVRCDGDKRRMADNTIGERLIALRARSGLSMDEVARRMGMRGRSSVQRFFVPHLNEITPTDAFRLAEVFDGTGKPSITRDELYALSPFPLAEVAPNPTLPPKYMQLPRDVPVYGTAMGTLRQGGEGQDIEEAYVDRTEVIEHFARPPGYVNRVGLYGLYVSGSSMAPRWEHGDPLYVDPKRPPQIGDDVVVYLKHPEGEAHELEAVLLKRLVRVGATHLELEQYNPAATFQIERRRISAFHRVVPQRELLAFH